MADNKPYTTTFIPKKPLAGVPVQKKKKPTSLSGVLMVIVLVITIVAIGGVYAYTSILNTEIGQQRETIARTQESLDPDFIREMQSFERLLDGSDVIVSRHVSLAPTFQLLESLTLRSIRYTDFTFERGTEGPRVLIQGEAETYRAIANQAQILGESQYIEKPLFSDFQLRDTGTVNFSLEFAVAEDLLLFDETLGRLPQSLPTEQERDGQLPATSQTEQL